ncbi:piwi domain protein [Dictyocaulus viviparus]|uniref:Piwi domain protein n=2 Tax=Dictyocaulus viviparus TaxID=29172 RepID=A0A0D8X9I7_DICVI|nr:piwi domain protein [Dictyocaulus viviparus]
MDGKYMGIGLAKSVKVLEGEKSKCGPFLVTDVRIEAFHTNEQNLLDKISQMSIFFEPRTGTNNFSVDVACRSSSMTRILKVIKGLYVRTSYGNRRTFPIGNLAAAANILRSFFVFVFRTSVQLFVNLDSVSSFEAPDGKRYTVERYFAKRYNIKLKYPSLFTVSERHNPEAYYPVEVLLVAPSQRVTNEQQTQEDVAAVRKASTTLPEYRLKQTKVMKDALKMIPGNTDLEAAGISVDSDFTKVFGRVLPSPTVLYGESERVTINNCKWDWDHCKFIQPGNLSNWAVCATLTLNDSRRLNIRDYIARLENRCRFYGMAIESPTEIFYPKEKTAEELKQWYAKQKNLNRQYLMFITSDCTKQHDLIKLLELQYQIVSQEVKANKVYGVMSKNLHKISDCVIAKINGKFGGLNYSITLNAAAGDRLSNWLSDSNVLFIDLAISNPPPSSKTEFMHNCRYPSLFTVSERHNPEAYYLVEVLFVAPSQRVLTQQQTQEDVAAVRKASTTLPKYRLKQTKVMKDALKMIPGNTDLEAAGISVDSDFTKVFGRVLPSPTVLYGESESVTINNCKWDWDHCKFIQPGNLSNWAVCATLTLNDSRRLNIRDYIARLENRCRFHGMAIKSPAEIFYPKEKSAEELKQWYAKQKDLNRQYLMFITSDGIKQHDLIKLLELQYQIVSQEVKANKVYGVMSKNLHKILDCVIAKINEKIGGLNYSITLNAAAGDRLSNWLSDSSVLFIGFAISNPPPSSKAEPLPRAIGTMPSVLGWGANCASIPQQFIGDYVYVESRQSDMVGSKLADVVIDIIERHRVATLTAPRHIIFYFSGISEGQFHMITHFYMRAISNALSSLERKCAASVTALAVSRDHNERIYQANITGERAVDQNIPAGTVVDTKIVSPVINEFYLNAHVSLKGTVKSPKYSLLADNSTMSMDIIEGFTYGLCFLHEISSSTVSVPAPLLVADRCAKRGHNIYLANMKRQQFVVNNINDANQKLVNYGNLKKVRFNA